MLSPRPSGPAPDSAVPSSALALAPRAVWIEQQYGITVGVRQCQRLFRQLGFRLRQPRPQIAGADEEQQKTHKKNSKR